MALTPEDVVNKRFQPTKFREGYDQDEVDDFLDEVVVELRRLGQENDQLRQRLVAGESRISELQRSGSQAPASSSAENATQAHAVQAPAVIPAPPVYPAATDPNSESNNTNNLLQLARKLHEEHVREGIEKRDALIAEGHATAARVVSEAETQQREQIGVLDQERAALEQERAALEQRIDGLRTFEREYRQKLKGYIEGQLRELDSTSVGTNSAQPQQQEDAAQALPSSQEDDQPSAPQPAVFGGGSGSQPPVTFQGFGGN